MAKAKTTRTTSASRSGRAGDIMPFDLDEWLGKYIWVLVPVLVMLYYLFSQGSTGFYQDDEIGHYNGIRLFFSEPFSIMGNQPKPGWKILMVLPSLFGAQGVLLAHCLMAALTVVATYYLGRTMKIRNSSVGAILLAAQPLFLQLSFRTYSEITAGLLAVLMLLFYQRKNYILAAVFSSYIFSIRQEFALISIILGVILLMKRQWVAFLMLAWTPIVLAIIGWAVTGNPRWLLDDMWKIGAGVVVPHRHFWHYFETYIFMVGPVTLALLVIGYWSFLAKGKGWMEGVREYGFFFLTFTVMWAWAVFSAWDVPNFGANPGHWRYLLSIAPLTAVYATIGLNTMLSEGGKKYASIALGVLLLIVLVFLSRETDGFVLKENTRSYANLLMVFVVFVVFLMTTVLKAMKPRVAIIALLVVGIGFTVYAEKPRKLNSEGEAVKEAATWYQSQPLKDRPLYCNHTMFSHFAGIDCERKNASSKSGARDPGRGAQGRAHPLGQPLWQQSIRRQCALRDDRVRLQPHIAQGVREQRQNLCHHRL